MSPHHTLYLNSTPAGMQSSSGTSSAIRRINASTLCTPDATASGGSIHIRRSDLDRTPGWSVFIPPSSSGITAPPSPPPHSWGTSGCRIRTPRTPATDRTWTTWPHSSRSWSAGRFTSGRYHFADLSAAKRPALWTDNSFCVFKFSVTPVLSQLSSSVVLLAVRVPRIASREVLVYL